jgi:CHAT domain-containing protein
LPTGGVAPGTGGTSSITISSRNTPPTLSTRTRLSGAEENQPFAFTYADLNPRVVDADGDNTSLVIGQINSGTLTVNGTVAIAGVTVIAPGDQLVYTPPANTTGTIANAFALQAIDANQIASSTLVPIEITVAGTPPVPPQPPSVDLQNPLLPIIESAPPLALTSLACSATDAGVYSLEDKFTREFEEYFEKRAGTSKTRLLEACDALSRVETQTGVKPAVIYVSFGPSTIAPADSSNPGVTNRPNDQLELVAVFPDRAPVYKRVSGATRSTVFQVMRQFAIDLIDPTSRDTDSFLPGAQQLYQWLVQPLATELQTQNVKNLVFILDAGLRSLPVAALHDGKQFLVEQYSLGIMPSLSITDTRYRDLKGAAVLAAGAAQFTEQKPLPAVPIELSTIFAAGWAGQSILNQAFTLNNLKTQRQQQPYGIVHLATHAEFNPGAPQNSYIQFWDTKLRLDQVRQLNWDDPPVQLLTLSACRTALGDEQAELGFAGLAYQTGVRSVLASLWAVDDTGTLSLMTEFYRQLKTAPIRAEALRQAQLAMIRGQVRIESGQLITPSGTIQLPPELADLESTAFSSPFYWSAFTLIGNPW